MESDVYLNSLFFTTLAMWGSSMSYYFNYFVDKTALLTSCKILD